MNELLTTLGLRHVEKGLPDLYEQARMHSLTYDAFLRRVLTLEVEARKLVTSQKRLKAAKLPTRKTLEEFDFSFQPSLDERHVWELADLSFVKTNHNVVFLGPPGVGNWRISPLCAQRPMSCFWDRRAPATLDQLTTPIELIMSAPQETVTVVDPCHPLFGRTLPCVGIANSSHRGRCCIVWIRPTVERHVPIAATNLEYDPTAQFPLPISVESLRQFLQEYLLVTGGWKGDPSDDSTIPGSSGSATKTPPASDPTHGGVDDAHPRTANHRSPGLRNHVSRVSAQQSGEKS